MKNKKYLIIKKWVNAKNRFSSSGYYLDTRYAEILGETDCFWKVILNNKEFKVKKKNNDLIFESKDEAIKTCKEENIKWNESDFVFDENKKYVKAKVLILVNCGSNKYTNWVKREEIIEDENINEEILNYRILQAFSKEELENTNEELTVDDTKEKLDFLWGSYNTKKKAASKLWEKIKFGIYTRDEKDTQVEWANKYTEEAKAILEEIKKLTK